MSKAELEVYFDCSSPWTYIGFHNVLEMAKRVGVEIDWKPILVGGVFNAINPSVYEGRAKPVKVKARYHLKDMQDWARLAGLTIKFPPRIFPVNSVKVMRACIALKPDGKLVDFARAAFEIYWGEDRDMSDDAVVGEICARADVEVDELWARIQRQEIKDQLRANTDELIARGGFGSPTMFVGDDMYFGNDRIVLVEEAVLRLSS